MVTGIHNSTSFHIYVGEETPTLNQDPEICKLHCITIHNRECGVDTYVCNKSGLKNSLERGFVFVEVQKGLRNIL